MNHPKGDPSTPRDYQDRIGAIHNVALRPGEGLFGDFQFNPKHALAEQLLWDAEHAPENVGFSHNVEARVRRSGERVVVEAILRVQSVDLVADPATTRGLFESAASGEDAPLQRSDSLPVSDSGVAAVGVGRIDRRRARATSPGPGRSDLPGAGGGIGPAAWPARSA